MGSREREGRREDEEEVVLVAALFVSRLDEASARETEGNIRPTRIDRI